MNVLLINPNREQMPWPAIPVGLCTVATAVERGGHTVKLLDLTFSKQPREDTAKAVRAWEPDVVAVTIRNIDNCNFESPHFYLSEVRDQVMRCVRDTRPSATLVIGGSAVNVSPWETYRYLEADYALVGEGELSLLQLLDALASNQRNLLEVQGLLSQRTVSPRALPILDTGRLGYGEPVSGRAMVADLDGVSNSESFRWVDHVRYERSGAPYSIQTKRGCALKCSYCVYNNIEGHGYRLRSPESVADEIEEAVAHGVRQVDFVDSTFNLPLSHARGLCEELIRREFPVEFSTMGLNPAGLTKELVVLMKRAGFKNVMCTPESASETTLATLNKGFQKHAVVRAAELLRAAELPTYWFFMLGAPKETLATVRETLEFCEAEIPNDHMVLFSTGIRVYAGTPLETICKEMGWFAPDDPLFYPSWFLSPELDLHELYAALVRAAERHPNWMTNAETVLSPALSGIMKHAFRLMGWRGAFWQHLPKVFKFAGSLGVRQKGLEQHAKALRAVSDIRHHS